MGRGNGGMSQKNKNKNKNKNKKTKTGGRGLTLMMEYSEETWTGVTFHCGLLKNQREAW